MKTLLFALATLTAGVGSVHASLFSPSVVPGALIGGVAGAVIGNNSGGHNGSNGAVIGAVAGGLIGAAMDNDHDRSNVYYTTPAPGVESCPPTVIYREPAPRVIYAPAPAPRREIYVAPYVAPRHEVVIAHADRDHRGGNDRNDRDERRSSRR